MHRRLTSTNFNLNNQILTYDELVRRVCKYSVGAQELSREHQEALRQCIDACHECHASAEATEYLLRQTHSYFHNQGAKRSQIRPDYVPLIVATGEGH
jgi:hypothetical protein